MGARRVGRVSDESENLIRVSAVVLRDANGAVLTVRKRGTDRFMLPGGKPEQGEDAATTAARECREEIGVDLHPGTLVPLGVFRAAAANEAGYQVEGAVFAYAGLVEPAAAAEIAELRWLDPRGPLPGDLAPLLRDRVLPALASR